MHTAFLGKLFLVSKKDSCFSSPRNRTEAHFGIHLQDPSSSRSREPSRCRGSIKLTHAGSWPAAPHLVVHARHYAVAFQLVSRRAVVLTPRAEVGAIQTLEAPVGWHGEGGAALLCNGKHRFREIPPFRVMSVSYCLLRK